MAYTTLANELRKHPWTDVVARLEKELAEIPDTKRNAKKREFTAGCLRIARNQAAIQAKRA